MAKGKNVFQIKKGNPKGRDTVMLIRSLAEAQRCYIRQVLRITKWKIKGEGGAAELLGVPSSTLHSKMKKLGIRRPKRYAKRHRE